MFVIDTIKSYMPFSSSPDTVEVKNKKDFELLLRTKEANDVHDFVLKHPELLDATLYNSHLTPLELSLSLKKVDVIKQLIEDGAQINLPNKSGISFLDHIILKKDQNLLKDVFGSILGGIFYNSHIEIESSQFLDLILRTGQLQLQSIYDDIKRYQDLSQFENSNNTLIQNLQNLSELKLIEKEAFSSKEAFDAFIYAILTHQNEAVEILYNQFGSDILRMQTTDFKNLFHIAAIANNAKVIEKLIKWDLIVSSPSSLQGKSLHLLSPFHYAIAQPSLEVFTALLNSKLEIPKPASLFFINLNGKGGISRSELKKYIADLSFNPLQLLVIKANIHDPLPKEDRFTTVYLIIEALNLIAEQYSPLTKSLANEIKLSLTLFRTCFFFANIATSISKNQFPTLQILLKILFSFLCYGPVYAPAIFQTGLAYLFELVNPLSSYYTPIATILMIKKVWNDFTAYQNAYLFRPGKTFWTFTKDMFMNFIFVKSHFFDSKIYFDYSGQTPKPSPYSYSSSDQTKEVVSELKTALKKLHPKQIDECTRNQSIDLNDILNCLKRSNAISKNLIVHTSYLTKKQVKTILKSGLMYPVHPTQCNRKFSENQIQKLCEKIMHTLGDVVSRL